MFEKVGKNHVPTCPVFAGPVTYISYPGLETGDNSIQKERAVSVAIIKTFSLISMDLSG